MKQIEVVAAASLLFASFARGADLVVPRGEVIDLTANCIYETITVHGTLNVANGAGVSVKTILLGPDTGDTAVINIAGVTGYLGNGSTVVTNGLNGGTGRIVAPGSTSGDDVGLWDWDSVLRISKVVLARDVAASSAGFVDLLELGNVTIAASKFENMSSLRGRIKVRGGRLGLKQSWGSTLFSGAFEVDTVDGRSVAFGNNWAPYSLTGNPGDLVFGGTGSVCLGDSQNDDDAQFVTLNPGISWHEGDLVLRNYGKVKTASDDILPHGQGKGAVRVDTKNGWLHLNATTQHLNGLDATKGKTTSDGGYAVLGSAGAKLVFGGGDTDGSLGGAVSPTVSVEKIGAGTLSVTDVTTVGGVTVSAGTMTVRSALSLAALSVAAGATLVIDGVTLTPSSTDIAGTVTLLNGGQLVNPVAAETSVRTAGLSLPGALVKSGTGTLVLENPTVMADHVHVKAGALAFSGSGYDVPLYRLTVTEQRDETPDQWELAEFAFVDSTGTRLRQGLTERPIGTSPADLKPGEMTVPAGYEYALNYWHLDALFDRNPYSATQISKPKLAESGKIELYVRLPETANPIVGYNWAPSTDNSHPLSWTLSGSSDGGVTWETLSKLSNFCNWYLPYGTWVDMNVLVDKVADDAVPARFKLLSQNPDFATGGVRNMPETMSVEVDAGARLDFGNVTDGQTVLELCVNADNGGGSIVNAAFPAAGTLALTSAGDELPDVIPLSLTDCSGVDNLQAWDVVLNGALKRSGRYRYVDEALRRVRKGLCLILR